MNQSKLLWRFCYPASRLNVKSIRGIKFSHIKVQTLKSASHGGASKASLLAQLANNPIPDSSFPSFLLLSSFLSPLPDPPLCYQMPSEGSRPCFHGPCSSSLCGVVYVGGACPAKGDAHFFKRPYSGCLKGRGRLLNSQWRVDPRP